MENLINQAIENNTNDFKILKKHYSERFAKLCRTLFPTILEEKGTLSSLILSKFAPSKFLYEDIVNNYATERFKNFIYGLYVKEDPIHHGIKETPEQLFDKAGYILYKCDTNEEVLYFKKYFAEGEKLCTFTDPNRIKTHTIFFAVKKNVDEIKRENYSHPRRQDEYGTSVISLQFSKGKNSILSIKNRYNHKVENPDATFSNDLENIYPGLTDSFVKFYAIHQIDAKHNFDLPSYVKAKDGKYYRYNHEINNIYYCTNNIIIQNYEPRYYDSRRYDIIDYFIIDKQRKAVVNPNPTIDDKFDNSFKDDWGNSYISKIEISKNLEEKTFDFTLKDDTKIIVVVDKYNRIIEYHNHFLTTIPKSFLFMNTTLKELDTPNVITIENFALNKNQGIKTLYLPSLETVGTHFMDSNSSLEEIYTPNLRSIDFNSFRKIDNVKSLYLPKLVLLGQNIFSYAENLEEFIAPLLTEMGQNCLSYIKNIKSINIKSMRNLLPWCLYSANNLINLIAPNLVRLDSHCLSDCKSMKTINLPKLEELGSFCFYNADNLEELYLPKLKLILDDSFVYCDNLRILNAPKLKKIGQDCFTNIGILDKMNVPSSTKQYLGIIIKKNSSKEFAL